MIRYAFLAIGVGLWVAAVIVVGPLVEDLFRLIVGALR